MTEVSSLRNIRRVGFWWSEKKSRKFNVHEFAEVCRSSGLELVKIDLNVPLEEQGPFSAIVHKLSDAVVRARQGDLQSKAICQAFQDYEDQHPETVIIDSLANVEKLLDRYRQYKLVKDSELQKEGGAFSPAFVELTTNDVQENIAKIRSAGVTFPCVCKPSIAHGSTLAHQMCLVFNEEGLRDISPPCVAQTFVNHNAVLFKLFIVGDKYFVIERPSLKNFTAGDNATIFFDSHDISKAYSASSLTELDDSEPRNVIWPEKKRMDLIVRVLCEHLGLTLFGIDIIIDNKTGHYAIIDMNIFPGYDEVHNFFQVLRDVIVQRITLRNMGITNHNIFRPTLSNCSWNPPFMVRQGCGGMCFNSVGGVGDCHRTNVIPYSVTCFCCPITSTCHNAVAAKFCCLPENSTSMLLKSDPVPNDSLNESDQNNPLIYLATKVVEFSLESGTQDDSGIETSDSCDEKKNKIGMKVCRRQHSKCSIPSSEISESS